jgi:hypothetical protein
LLIQLKNNFSQEELPKDHEKEVTATTSRNSGEINGIVEEKFGASIEPKPSTLTKNCEEKNKLERDSTLGNHFFNPSQRNLENGEVDNYKNETIITKKKSGKIIFHNEDDISYGESSTPKKPPSLLSSPNLNPMSLEEPLPPENIYGESQRIDFQNIEQEFDNDDYKIKQRKLNLSFNVSEWTSKFNTKSQVNDKDVKQKKRAWKRKNTGFSLQ